MHDNKKQFSITLTEPVVFLRSLDPSGRYSDPNDPPAVVRGVLTLNVVKPIGISSIDVELSGALTTQFSDGVASHRIDIQEKHKVYSSSITVFCVDHASHGRRPPSGEPGSSTQNTINSPGDPINLSYLGSSPRRRSELPSVASLPPDLGPTPPYSPRALSPVNSTDLPDELGQAPRDDLEGSFEQPRSCQSRPHSIALFHSNSTVHSAASPIPSPSLLQESDDRPSASGTSFPSPSETFSSVPLRRPSHLRSHSCPHKDDPNSSNPSPARSRFRISFNNFLGTVKEVTSRSPPGTRDNAATEDWQRGRTRVRSAANEHHRASTRANDCISSTRNTHPPRANTCPGGHERPLLDLGRILGMERGNETESDSHQKCAEGWKEFKPGSYSYPISFLLPSNLPPTFCTPRGSLDYIIKAVAHRPGTFTSKLSCQASLLVVAAPTAGGGEGGVPGDPGPLNIERQWESKLAYSLDLSSRLFLLGSQRHLGAATNDVTCTSPGSLVAATTDGVYGTAVLTLTLLPLEKVKIWRLSIVVDQHISYFDGRKKLLRDEDKRQVKLLEVQDKCLREELGPADRESMRKNKNPCVQIPLLPTPLSPDRSPLLKLMSPSVDPSILTGPGPYVFSTSIGLPHCGDRGLRFSMKQKSSYVKVEHWLRLVMRVENVGEGTNSRDGEKKFDVTVQTPITVLSCRCIPEQQTLPVYSPAACLCQPSSTSSEYVQGCEAGNEARSATSTSSESVNWQGEGHWSHERSRSSSRARPTAQTHSHGQPHSVTATLTSTPQSSRPPSPLARYERLVSGLESEAGEAPPSYESIATRY